MKPRSLLFFICLAALIAPPLLARGKNKINYDNFNWKIYQSQHYKFYFYPEEEHLLENMVDISEAAYKLVSEKLQHQLDFPVPLIFFKTHEEFLQNNINPGFLPRAVRAFADPFQSRMVLPIDDSPEDLFALVTHELTHIFQFDMLYNNRISTIIRANSPTWFREGMASWVADDEDNLDRMALRDVAVNGGFNSLSGFDGFSFLSYRVGHAAFSYMEQEYGIEGVRNFLWQYRKNITGSVTAAIERAFETDIVEFNRDFRKWLRKQYIELLPVKEEPDDHAREIRTRRVITTLSPELSPSGDLFAAIVPYKNDLDLVLISTKDGRIFRNLTKGYTNRFAEINVGAFRGVNDIGWKEDGNAITFTARKEGTNRIFVIDVLKGKILEDLFFEDIKDAQAPIFSKDGNSLYFVGNRGGFYDVFHYTFSNKKLENVTHDEAVDRNPRLSPDGNRVLYSSERNGFFKIYDLDLKTGEKAQLTSGLGNDIQATYSQDMKRIYFSSDRYDDIYNVYSLDIEAGMINQYTNILTGAFSPQERITFDHKEGVERKQLVFTAYYQGRYRVYRMEKPEERQKEYSITKDNFSNVKDYDLTANVKLDPRRFREYKIKNNFSIHGANVSVGTTTDGLFLTNSQVAFADTVGERVLSIDAYSISSFETYQAQYIDRSRRWQWGAYGLSRQLFLVDRFSTQLNREERVYKVNELAGLIRYPVSLYSRIDFGLGVTDQDRFNLTRLDNGGLAFESVDFTEPFAFISLSRDTVRYREYGPQQGMSVDLTVREDLDTTRSASLDFRAYKELTARSLFATRFLGDYSDGDVPDIYYLGGFDALRGDYEYQQFLGSRRGLVQLEWRFPLVDHLRFPGGIAFGNIRGSIFVETGAIYFEDDDFNFEFQDSLPPELQRIVDEGFPHEVVDPTGQFFNAENPDQRYLLGAYGFEITMNLLGLQVHWTWARRTNFDLFPSSSRMSFWIGYNF